MAYPGDTECRKEDVPPNSSWERLLTWGLIGARDAIWATLTSELQHCAVLGHSLMMWFSLSLSLGLSCSPLSLPLSSCCCMIISAPWSAVAKTVPWKKEEV